MDVTIIANNNNSIYYHLLNISHTSDIKHFPCPVHSPHNSQNDSHWLNLSQLSQTRLWTFHLIQCKYPFLRMRYKALAVAHFDFPEFISTPLIVFQPPWGGPDFLGGPRLL